MKKHVCALVLSAALAVCVSSASAGRVGHWRLNGDMTDSSPGGHNGSAPVNGAWVAGKLGLGLQLAGTGYADIPLPTPLGDFSSGFTVALWLKAPGTGGDALGYWPSSGSGGFGLQSNNWWTGNASGSGWKSSAGGRLSDDQWHFHALSWDGASTLTSYRDGVQVGINTSASGLVVPAMAQLTLGADNRNHGDKLTGVIDDVSAWDRGWGPAIRVLYNIQNLTGTFFDAAQIDPLFDVYQETVQVHRDGYREWVRAEGFDRQPGDAWILGDTIYLQLDDQGNGVVGTTPEPLTLGALVLASAGLGGYLRRRRR